MAATSLERAMAGRWRSTESQSVAARLLAIVLTLPAVGVSGFQALFVPLIMNVCFDSCDGTYWELHPGRAAATTGFVVAAFASACLFACFVAAGWPRRATQAFVVHVVLAVLIVGYWVEGASESSDDDLLGIAAGTEFLAFMALVVCRSDARRRLVHPRAAS